MKRLLGGVTNWLSARGSGLDQVKGFLNKPIPRNVSWVHTLGSLLLVYLGFQALTGILLGFYYSPSVHDAYQSVRYIREQLFLGEFLLKLHRYGAAFLMVTAFLHFARSLLLGSYKRPRELLWLTGMGLGVLFTLFAFTGQLLPYDQHGYWATSVGIRIATSAPGMKDLLYALLTGGYGNIGAVTLSRFFILHVAVLPMLLAGLIALHLSILQRVGSSGPLTGEPGPMRRFCPSQLLKDLCVAALGAALLFAVAGAMGLEDTGPANPTGAGFEPRPEWYFLAHYQILRWLPGSLEVVGTFLLPNLVLGLLLLLPFLDRGPERAPGRRKLVFSLCLAFCLGLVGLTAVGMLNTPDVHVEAAPISDPLARGRQLLDERKCTDCHSIGGQGGDKGPSLDDAGRRLRADYLPDWIRNPRNFKPQTDMPSFEGTESELDAIVTFLLQQTGDTGR